MPLRLEDVDLAAARREVPLILTEIVKAISYEHEQQVVAYLLDRLRGAGARIETRDVEPGRQNIVARIGSGNRSLVLHGHMDTVPPDVLDAWTHPAFSGAIVDGELWGRGSSDAKGPLAGMVAAFEAIAGAGGELPGELQLWCVAMEERAGVGTEVEVAAGTRAEAAIIGEPTHLEVHVAHKGALRMKVSTTGVAAHSSAPWDGQNAITRMAPVILELDALGTEIARRTEEPVGRASLAVTLADGGVARNVIPPVCSVIIDRRLLPKEDPREAFDEVVRRMATLEAKPKVEEVTLAEAARTDVGEPIVACAMEARRQTLGVNDGPGGFAACCDMRFLTNNAKVPAVILGPGDMGLAHKIDERISVAELEHSAELYVRLALNWLGRS